MPTVDITAPSGAFTPAAIGDCQQILAGSFSISSGSFSLTCNSASPFLSSDTGRAFALQNAVPSSLNTNTFQCGSLTYVSPNQVTLNLLTSISISPSSQILNTISSGQNTDFYWGYDNSSAFTQANIWAQAQTSSITLTFGSSSVAQNFLLITPNFPKTNSLPYNVQQPMHVLGNGSSLTTVTALGCLAFGVLIDYDNGGNCIRVNNVSSGATQFTLMNSSNASLLTVGNYVNLSGLDLQGSGQPPNTYFSEFCQVTGASTGTGIVTVQNPIRNSYLSTWPGYTHVPQNGGPAAIFLMLKQWIMNVTYDGISFNILAGQPQGKGSNVNFNNTKWISGAGYSPSQNVNFSVTGSDWSSFDMEYDKVIDTAVFDSTVLGQVLFQSVGSDIPVIFQNGCNITRGINSTPKKIEIHNSTVNGLQLGGFFYGYPQSFVTTGSSFTGSVFQWLISPADTVSGSVPITISNGIITIPKSYEYPPSWAVPGAVCFWGGGASGTVGSGPKFTISSVWDDTTNVYAQTDWYGPFPSYGTNVRLFSLPYQYGSASTISSTMSPIIQMAQTTALGIYDREVYYFGSLNGSNVKPSGMLGDTNLGVAGKVVSITVNVTTPYTGTHGTLQIHTCSLSDNGTYINSGYLTYVPFGWAGPVIDLRTAGKRVITPSGVTGAAGSDHNLALPDPGMWIPRNFPQGWAASSDITAEYAGNPSVGPVFTVEMIMQQPSGLPMAGGTRGIFGISNNSNMIIRR